MKVLSNSMKLYWWNRLIITDLYIMMLFFIDWKNMIFYRSDSKKDSMNQILIISKVFVLKVQDQRSDIVSYEYFRNLLTL